MVTENTPYRNKKYIVEWFEFDTKFKNEKEIKQSVFGTLKAKPRMREFLNSLIRCRIIWVFIFALFHTVTTDPTR